MQEQVKLQNALNFVRSELADEMKPKMDKHLNYDKIALLQRIIQKLI